MYTLVRSMPIRRLITEQLPTLLLALAIAEIFYKFHSFLLETGAFLLTWFVLDAVTQFVVRRFAKPQTTSAPPLL